MKIKPHSRKIMRHRIQHLVNTWGARSDKQAYASIINNIIGLTRKVQSLNKKLKNNQELNEALNTQLAEAHKNALFNNAGNNVSMGVGDGTGNLVVHGNYESIKAAQAIVLRDMDTRIACHHLACHIASSKGALPDEWYEWAKEIEEKLRAVAWEVKS